MILRHSAPTSRFVAILFLLVTRCCIGLDAIGINYGTVANNLPSAAQVVQLLQTTSISKVKIYSTDDTILSAFANTGIDLIVGAPNDQIAPLAASESYAQQWLTNNVASHYPSTKIVTIVVGNEVLTSFPNASNQLVPAMQNLHSGLVNLGLSDQIKVSTPNAFSVLNVSYPPSSGIFRADVADSVFAPMLDFLSQTGSTFMINVYPYFGYRENPKLSIAYALFEPNSGEVDPNTGLTYMNLFDAQVDATYAALAKLGHQDIKVTVSETGWPSFGDVDEVGVSVTNAQTYIANLIQHINSNSGTPNKKGVIDTYIFALFNENQKPGPGSERNFGLFFPDKSTVYNVGINANESTPPAPTVLTTSPPPPATNVPPFTASPPPPSTNVPPFTSSPPPTSTNVPPPPFVAASPPPPTTFTPSPSPPPSTSTPPPPFVATPPPAVPPPPFTAPPPPYPVPHVPPSGPTLSSPPPPSIFTTPPPPAIFTSPPPPAVSTAPPPPAATVTPPPPSFFTPPPGSSTTPPPAAGTPPFLPSSPPPPAAAASPPPFVASPPPFVASPPPFVASPPPFVASPPPFVASPPPFVASPPPVATSPPPPAAASPPPPAAVSPPPAATSPPPPAAASPPPVTLPPPGTPPAAPGTPSGPNTWCVAKPGSPTADLLNALNYACGEGGADCTQIQGGQACFNPDTLFSHASFAFSSYYAANGRNYWNCFFGNSSLITITNPSYTGCEYP